MVGEKREGAGLEIRDEADGEELEEPDSILFERGRKEVLDGAGTQEEKPDIVPVL